MAFIPKSPIYKEDEESKTRGPSWKREELGISEKGIMYRVTFVPTAEESFKKLDPSTQGRIAQRIDWLSGNADKIIHHPLKSLPDDLHGLCRMRTGERADEEVILKPVEKELPLHIKDGVLVFSGAATGDIAKVVKEHRERRLKKVSSLKRKSSSIHRSLLRQP